MAAEIHTDPKAVLQQTLIREGFGGGSSFLHVKEAHLQTFIRKFFLLYFLSLLLIAGGFVFVACTFCLLSRGSLLCVVSLWCKGEAPPVALTKKLLANLGTSLGMELSSICSCILLRNLDSSFTAVVTIFVSNLSSPTSILLVLIKFCEKDAKCIKKLVDFCHENHGKMCKQVFIVAHPGFCSSFFDEPNQPPSKLVEERFSRRDDTRHGDMFLRADLSDPLNQRRKLLPVLLNNTPIDLIAFGFHFDGGFLDKLLVVLRCIVKRMDRHGFINCPGFEIGTLETCSQMPLHKILGKDNEGHQSVEWMEGTFVVLVFLLGRKDCVEEINEQSGLDCSQPAEEIHEALGKCCCANIFDGTTVLIDVAGCIH
jgi:hypothetical protein